MSLPRLATNCNMISIIDYLTFVHQEVTDNHSYNWYFIIIIILESAVQGRERVRTLYQSKDTNP